MSEQPSEDAAALAAAIWREVDEWWEDDTQETGGLQGFLDRMTSRFTQVGWWHDEFGFTPTKRGVAGPENSGEPVYVFRVPVSGGSNAAGGDQ